MTSDRSDQEELAIRDRLALDRTQLANERTFLAYVRTAIMVGVSGITLLKLFPRSRGAQVSGWLLLPIAVIVLGVGFLYFVRRQRCFSHRRR